MYDIVYLDIIGLGLCGLGFGLGLGLSFTHFSHSQTEKLKRGLKILRFKRHGDAESESVVRRDVNGIICPPHSVRERTCPGMYGIISPPCVSGRVCNR